ncbi:hypothetical protein F379_169 [Campylobacter phage F379]|uniref:Uncharacterized protein n=2 Tax=Firehammervirus TaxID=1636617 RepID=I7KLQ2_9CAUD|nr:hypothetical protein F421_gp116 [Campylobacter phage CP21]EAK3475152.1 hypothetical protein [Campylobacter coli]QOI69455.1 hypothetical protein F379_169 [Campylobacter phage F379]QXO06304.1 hypothetical protein [Campylobacter phage CJLB-12]QXO06537.1 hypothetical protein [Campylobacter phage CJLB-14]CCH63578.1 hypothetical protein [Campylobacter phage CP21]
MYISKQLTNYLDNYSFSEANKTEAEVCNVRDYRSMDYSTITKYINDSNTINVKINANDFIESVSNRLYNDPNLWDLLMLINNKDALSDMPYDNDRIADMADELIANYFNNPEKPYQGNVTEQLITEYREYLIDLLTQKNYQNMIIKALDPAYLGDFLRLFKYK